MAFFNRQPTVNAQPDYADLVKQARYMMQDLFGAPSMLEPLINIAEQLSSQPLYAADAMKIYAEITQSYHCDHARKQGAIDGFNKSAQLIVDDEERIEAFANAGEDIEQGEIKRHIAAGILWSARNLSGSLRAQKFYQAALHAPRGSALERQAVEKCVLDGEALTSPDKPAHFFADAAVGAPADSLLEEKTVDAFIRHVNRITDQASPVSRHFAKAKRAIIESHSQWDEPVSEYNHKERMACLFSATCRATAGGLLDLRATAEYVRYVELLPDPLARIETYMMAAKASRPDSVMKQAVLEGILRNAPLVTSTQSVRAFHLVRKEAVDARDKPLEKKIIAALVAHIEGILQSDSVTGMKMYALAAEESPKDSDAKRQMVEGILRHADNVPDIYDRTDFLMTAARHAPRDSGAERAAIARFVMNVNAIPDIPTRISFYDAVVKAAPKTALCERAKEEKNRLTSGQDQIRTSRPDDVVHVDFGRSRARAVKINALT